MDTKVAAARCREFVNKATSLPDNHPEYGRDHLHYMIDEIASGRVSGEKSHRWLGFLQGVLVATGTVTLKEMKQINFEA